MGQEQPCKDMKETRKDFLAHVRNCRVEMECTFTTKGLHNKVWSDELQQELEHRVKGPMVNFQAQRS
jgi:hypothetical protein